MPYIYVMNFPIDLCTNVVSDKRSLRSDYPPDEPFILYRPPGNSLGIRDPSPIPSIEH
jgi:hypothetical protein